VSVSVQSDVHCDGASVGADTDRCFGWIEGVSGLSVDRPGARAKARSSGWVHQKGKDLCPGCAEGIGQV
jgi:hypothetical protein